MQAINSVKGLITLRSRQPASSVADGCRRADGEGAADGEWAAEVRGEGIHGREKMGEVMNEVLGQ